MAASSMSRAPFLLPLARQLLPLRVVAPSARLPLPAPARGLCFSLQLLRHCASSSPSCERAQDQYPQAPSAASAGPSCDSSEGEPAERGGDDKAAGAEDKGAVCPAAPAPARAAGRRRTDSPPKGRPGAPRQGGGGGIGKVHAADTAQAKRKGKGQRGQPGPPRQGPGGGGGVIHSVPSSPAPSSSSSSASSSSSSS